MEQRGRRAHEEIEEQKAPFLAHLRRGEASCCVRWVAGYTHRSLNGVGQAEREGVRGGALQKRKSGGEQRPQRPRSCSSPSLLLLLARSFRFDTSLLPPMLSLRAAALGAPAALALRGSSSRARSMSAWRGVPEKRDRGDEAPHSTLSSIHPHPPTPHSLVLGRQQHQRRQVHQARHPAPGRRRGRHAGRPPGPPSVAGAGRGGAEWRQRLGGGGQGMRERREREGERPESRSKRISWWPCSRARGRTRALWWCGQGRG